MPSTASKTMNTSNHMTSAESVGLGLSPIASFYRRAAILRGMSHRAKARNTTVAVVLVLALLASPLLLIGIALAEQWCFGTVHIQRFYRAIGIFDPLAKLLSWLRSLG